MTSIFLSPIILIFLCAVLNEDNNAAQKVIFFLNFGVSIICVCVARLVDVSAAENVGRVLAQRCLECGITNVFYEEEEGNTSEKVYI